MKTKKEKEKKAKAGKGLMAIGIISMMVIGMSGGIYYLRSNTNIDEGINNLLDDTEESWISIASFPLPLLGDEVDPGAGNSGILAVVCYEGNYPIDFGDNATDFDPDGGTDCNHTVYGYAHSAGFNEDLNHTVNWTLWVRVRVNYAHCGYDSDKFNDARIRCYLNLTSTDWTDGQNEASAIADGRVISANESSGGVFIYMWFYWDDSGGTGYAINSDGTVYLNANGIELEAKY